MKTFASVLLVAYAAAKKYIDIGYIEPAAEDLWDHVKTELK